MASTSENEVENEPANAVRRLSRFRSFLSRPSYSTVAHYRPSRVGSIRISNSARGNQDFPESSGGLQYARARAYTLFSK